MTTKEIIDMLQVAQGYMEWEHPMDFAVAADEAIKIIKKDIPKLPIYDVNRKMCMCPLCGQQVNDENYCPVCGQRLEWKNEI